MLQTPAQLEASGLEVIDLADETAYAHRRLRPRDGSMQMQALSRIAVAFVESPETILRELVDVAVQFCGADSAGISIEREDRTDKDYYEWVAIAGEYTPFLHAILPRTPSACSVSLERGSAQLFRVNQKFFDILGVKAAPVRDGILLPWQVEGKRGTIFIISHSSDEAFDGEDLHLMKVLANFTAMSIRQQRQQETLRAQAAAAAAASMANELAHQINNPLQSLTNILFIATQGAGVGDEKTLALKLRADFERLTSLTKQLLKLPVKER